MTFRLDVCKYQLGPVTREHRMAFACVTLPLCVHSGRWFFRVPAVMLVTEGVNTLLGAGLLFIRRAHQRRIERIVQRPCFRPMGLINVGVWHARA